jgi:hypothetical protein
LDLKKIPPMPVTRFMAVPMLSDLRRLFLCSLTFELKRTVEAGAVRLDCENAWKATGQPYSACRSGSAFERGVRRRSRCSAET